MAPAIARRVRACVVALLSLLALTALPSSAVAGPPAGKYVSTSGSDGADGSFGSPWRTLQRAADRAAGQVWVRGGTYAGFTLKRDGLTFAPYQGESVVVSGGTDVIRIDGVDGATVRGLIVRGAQGPRGAGILVASSDGVVIERSVLRDNKSYGIRTWNSTNVTIADNEITKNDEGIRVSYVSNGVKILRNDIHHNDSMIEPDQQDKGGGVGVAFLKSTGPVLAKNNRLWGNRAVDRFHAYDGGGFEIFGASDLTISQNVLWDNKHVMETGTADGYECANNRFVRNVAYAASSVSGYARGLLFACMSNSEVAHNVLHGFDQELLAVVRTPGYTYQGSLDDLRIRNNILISEGANVYYFSNVPASVIIDRNLIWNRRNDAMAYVVGTGSIHGYANLRSRLGYERNGVYGDPRVKDLAGRDYHLMAASPAVDRGVAIPGISATYKGSAPDIGRYESH